MKPFITTSIAFIAAWLIAFFVAWDFRFWEWQPESRAFSFVVAVVITGMVASWPGHDK